MVYWRNISLTKILQLLVLLMVMQNCNTFFHPEETSVSDIQNYEELVEAVNGVYGKLSEEISTHPNIFYNSSFKGDDLTNFAPNYRWFYYSIIRHCGRTEYPTSIELASTSDWDIFYSVIASVNNILSQYDLSTDLDELTSKILGELLLIRAYCHFRLTRTYGRILIIDDNELSYTTSLATYEEIYGFIENDLKKAVSLLPENNTSARIPNETPHRGTAKALLSEVYLSNAGYPANAVEKYTLAAKEAGELIDSAAYFGFELLDDYADVWKQDHLLCSENVFCLYYNDYQPSENVYYGVNNIFTGRASYGANVWGFTLSPNSYYFELFFPGSEMQFYNEFPSNYRKEVTFLSDIYVGPSPYVFQSGYINISKVNECDRIAYRKFFYDALNLPFDNYFPGWEDYYNDVDIRGMSKVYLFRYAQTLLTYAEATARSGQLNDKAYECVNEIRRRANHVGLYSPSVYDLQPGLSSEAFADSVVQERAWELAGEPEGRWFDIVRLNMIKELPNLRDPGEGGPPSKFDESAYFLAIPQEEIDLNPNLEE
jgi:starch-binding outer membrane protein, SusD/RagB family